jgi:hypothetical protein
MRLDNGLTAPISKTSPGPHCALGTWSTRGMNSRSNVRDAAIPRLDLPLQGCLFVRATASTPKKVWTPGRVVELIVAVTNARSRSRSVTHRHRWSRQAFDISYRVVQLYFGGTEHARRAAGVLSPQDVRRRDRNRDGNDRTSPRSRAGASTRASWSRTGGSAIAAKTAQGRHARAP